MAAYAPASTDDALAMLHASLDRLTCADWELAGAAAQRRALLALGAAASKLAVARGEALLAMDSSGGHAADGQPSARAWLRHQARVTRQAARDLCRQGRMLVAHPVLREALAYGELSQSWAGQLADWTGRLPAGEVDAADKILLDAMRAGLDLHPDLARLAQAIYEAVRGQQPDPDGPGDGFDDRHVAMGTTIGGAGKLRGDLSASCAALIEKAFAAFGKSAGPDDLRNPGMRNHDALEAALRLALGAPDIPETSGMKTRAMAVMSLADLLAMDGASALEDAWLTARAGEPGWFFGAGAQAAACAAQITPVVTGTADWDVLSRMADVFLDAHGLSDHGSTCDGQPGPTEHGPHEHGPAKPGPGKRDAAGGLATPSRAESSDGRGTASHRPAEHSRHRCGCTCGGCDCPPPRGLHGPLSPAARLALERTLLALSIRALTGPGGLAGFLRASLLGRPFTGASLVLDVGSTDDIPGHLRRAVILRDKHCQWPGGCDQPASRCEPHHHQPRAHGGPTALWNLDLYCLAHHHHFIHRLGWRIIKHTDGTRDAVSPDGKITRSHHSPSPATGRGSPGTAPPGNSPGTASPGNGQDAAPPGSPLAGDPHGTGRTAHPPPSQHA